VVTAPADPDSTVIFHVLAAVPEGSGPRLKGLTFRIEYDPERLTLADFGPCIGDLDNGAFELAGAGWPESATGTAIVFEYPRTDPLVTCYWFAGYVNSTGDSTFFGVTAHPDPALAGTSVMAASRHRSIPSPSTAGSVSATPGPPRARCRWAMTSRRETATKSRVRAKATFRSRRMTVGKKISKAAVRG